MAKIFRLQENVPDVYPRKSRDFQLLCNVFDIVNGGVKYDIDSIIDMLDTQTCSERLLPLLQTKLGFFTNKALTQRELRTVLSAFKYVVKDKGSNIGIREAIELYLKVIGASRNSKITALNKEYLSRSIANPVYIVEVSIEGKLTDLTLLTELLKYVLPAGYKLKYSFYTKTDLSDLIVQSDEIHIVIVHKSLNSSIQESNFKKDYSRVSTSTTAPSSLVTKNTYEVKDIPPKEETK